MTGSVAVTNNIIACFSTSITIDLKVTKELLLRKSLWMWNFGSHWPPLLASTIKGSMSTTHTLIGVSHTWTHLQSAVVQWSLYNYSGYPWDATNWLVYSGGLLKQNTEYHYHVMQVYHTAQAQILLHCTNTTEAIDSGSVCMWPIT